MTRDELLQRLQTKKNKGIPLQGIHAGSDHGQKAFSEGADFAVLYHATAYRKTGHGLLAGLLSYGDANGMIEQMGHEALPEAGEQGPLLAGICGTDPYRVMDIFLKRIITMGFTGVQNFPTVGFVDGTFRQHLHEADLDYDHEVLMIAKAHELGLFTCPIVFDTNQAEDMASAGADVLVLHPGLHLLRQEYDEEAMEDTIARLEAIIEAAKAVSPEIFTLLAGTELLKAENEDTLFAMMPELDGFFHMEPHEH